jgi:hypothetical protein
MLTYPSHAATHERKPAGRSPHRSSTKVLAGNGHAHEMLTPEPIRIDPHFSPQFYAEPWGMSPSTVIRWFEDRAGVLKLSKPAINGRQTRVELRIPFSLAMKVYDDRTEGTIEAHAYNSTTALSKAPQSQQSSRLKRDQMQLPVMGQRHGR